MLSPLAFSVLVDNKGVAMNVVPNKTKSCAAYCPVVYMARVRTLSLDAGKSSANGDCGRMCLITRCSHYASAGTTL
jgi:hypothetical protein